MSNSIKVHQSPINKFVPTGGSEEFYVVLQVEGNEMKGLERLPLNLSLVIDKSGSMYGRPLEYCKTAAKYVISQLTPQDLFSVVVFDNYVETVISPQIVEHKEILKAKIEGIQDGSTTNLSGGLLQGCQYVKQNLTDNRIHRVVVLTDGAANDGITDPEKLKKVTKEFSCKGVRVSTMGVGDSFEEDTIEAIAEAGEGNYYYVKKADDIPNAFSQELDGLLNVVAQNMTVNIECEDSVKVHEIYGYPYLKNGQSYHVSLGDINAYEKKTIIVKCSVLPNNKCETKDLFHTTWKYLDVVDEIKEIELKANVPITYTNDLDKLLETKDKAVEKQVEINNSAILLEKAIHQFDQGDFASGKMVLESQAKNMIKLAEELDDDDLKQEAFSLMESIENVESYTNAKRKELSAEKYRRAKNRPQK